MDIKNFDYELPKELIAQEPLPCREDSRMMVVERESSAVEHDRFRNITDYLRSGDALVVNDSRVIPARLLGRDKGKRTVEILLVSEREKDVWLAWVRPSKRVEVGLEVEISPGELDVIVLERLEGNQRLVKLSCEASSSELIERFGHVPLPPYIQRPDRPIDRERYQTVFAADSGSVAAPTAGLHFDREVLRRLTAKGVEIVSLTLHVGPGTFRPVREKDPRRHQMDEEHYRISPDSAERINRIRCGGGSVFAVGTTSARVLETVSNKAGRVNASEGRTDLFIYPPYTFQAVDRLITNFHLPKSTLLMLVAAFAGRDLILKAYREAIAERYRFYSYGDVMLIV